MKRIRIIIWDNDNPQYVHPIDIRELEWDRMYRKDGKFTAVGQEIMNNAIVVCTKEHDNYMTTEIFNDNQM